MSVCDVQCCYVYFLINYFQKFDPNFNLPISTNLKEISTTSDLSVFDSLWADPLPAERDYVTLCNLEINARGTGRTKSSDSEVSIELRVSCSEENSDNEKEHTVSTRPVTDGYVCADEHLPVQNGNLNLDSNSNFSLDFDAVQELFQNGQDVQKSEILSRESESENSSMSECELDLDFHDDTVQITSPQSTFTGQENQEYIRVDDVCFTYPLSETASDHLWDAEDISPSFNTTPLQHVTPCSVPIHMHIQSPFFSLQTNTEQASHSNLDTDTPSSQDKNICT